MTAATQSATPRWLLPQPVRAALHGMLLRGLRAPRLPHESGWADGTSGAWGMTPFQVRGGRGQHLAAWLALPRTARAALAVPVVVAVHGWGASGSTLASMVEPLVQAGIAVVLFDTASHGDSSAEAFSSLPRFAEDLAAVLDAHRLHASLRSGELLVVEGDHDLRVALAPHADQLVRFFCTHLEVFALPCLND
jgi:uncharacterized protein